VWDDKQVISGEGSSRGGLSRGGGKSLWKCRREIIKSTIVPSSYREEAMRVQKINAVTKVVGVCFGVKSRGREFAPYFSRPHTAPQNSREAKEYSGTSGGD